MDTGPQYLCYAFAHQYSDQDFKLTSLKSIDYYRARYVVDSCEKAGNFCVLFANLIRVKIFANDEEGMLADDEGELTLEHIVDIGGFRLRESLPVSEIHLQDWLYDSSTRDPDEQKGGGFMGNSYADIEQLYNNKVRSEVKYKILCLTHCLHRLWLLFLELSRRTFYLETAIPSLILQTSCNVFKNFSRCEMGTHLPAN